MFGLKSIKGCLRCRVLAIIDKLTNFPSITYILRLVVNFRSESLCVCSSSLSINKLFLLQQVSNTVKTLSNIRRSVKSLIRQIHTSITRRSRGNSRCSTSRTTIHHHVGVKSCSFKPFNLTTSGIILVSTVKHIKVKGILLIHHCLVPIFIRLINACICIICLFIGRSSNCSTCKSGNTCNNSRDNRLFCSTKLARSVKRN